MSRQQNQGKEYVILQNARFHELCAVLGLKDQCCSDPNKKVIEKAFRKKALKTHPDKGGDQKDFKKVNDAYNRLLGHITKLEIANEESEMSSNSIIIEVSKISLPKWRDKLKNKYGTPKCENVVGTLFEGPYKQYRGRSNNTGPITIVMYEDPQDGVPKLLIRAEKYMAWIAEQMMPLHLHVDKGRSIKFDQWRICHLAEFGFTSFCTASYSNPHADTPTPTTQPKRSEEPPKTKEEKAEAKEARKKARREVEKKKEEEADEKNNKDNSEPQKKEPFSHKIFEEAGKDMDDGDEWEEVPEDPNDPFPKLYNMAEQSYVKDGKRYRKKAKNVEKSSNVENVAFTCGSCGVGYANLLDYQHHKKVCIPDEDFGQADYVNADPVIEKKIDEHVDTQKKEQDVGEESVRAKAEPHTMPDFNFLTGNKKSAPKPPGVPLFECDGCGAGYDKMVAYSKHKAQCPSMATKHNHDEKTPNNDPKSASNDNKSGSSNNKANEQTNRIFEHPTGTNTGANITNKDVEDNAVNAKKDLCESAPPSGCQTLNMTHSKQRQATEKGHVTPNEDRQGSTGQTGLQNENLPFECKFQQKLTKDQNASEEMSQDKLDAMKA